jgi:hypothetical protein
MATTFAVPDGRVAMAATLYSGNNSTQTVSNIVNTVGMQPDLVWIKSRNISGANHVLTDSVRGVTKFVLSNLTANEYTIADTLTSFNSNGFSLGNTAYDFNITGNNYVGWQWKAGGTAVSNTAGSITSSVSANTTAGFSVVTWTGTGTGAASVGHGLSALPQLVFVKKRNVVANWYVASYGPQGLNYAYHLFLNTTDALSGSNDPYILGSQSSLTSNVLQLADGVSGNGGNQTGTNYVAYCWAPVAGYSAFGSYTGNGSTDGPFIYTGFRPRFLMIKRTDTAGNNWVILDTSRDTYNAAGLYLYPNLSAAEDDYRASTGPIDILSNGLKQRSTLSNVNASGGTYIYACFAENPLRYSNAR